MQVWSSFKIRHFRLEGTGTRHGCHTHEKQEVLIRFFFPRLSPQSLFVQTVYTSPPNFSGSNLLPPPPPPPRLRPAICQKHKNKLINRPLTSSCLNTEFFFHLHVSCFNPPSDWYISCQWGSYWCVSADGVGGDYLENKDGVCEAGFSATMSKDGETMLLGAPGRFSVNGKMILFLCKMRESDLWRKVV